MYVQKTKLNFETTQFLFIGTSKFVNKLFINYNGIESSKTSGKLNVKICLWMALTCFFIGTSTVSFSEAHYSAQNESKSRFRDSFFLFFVLCSVTYYGLFYCKHHWICIAPLETLKLHHWSCIAPLFLDTI